jgi:16S rRNA (cytosine967-C5)-methyltransferase
MTDVKIVRPAHGASLAVHGDDKTVKDKKRPPPRNAGAGAGKPGFGNSHSAKAAIERPKHAGPRPVKAPGGGLRAWRTGMGTDKERVFARDEALEAARRPEPDPPGLGARRLAVHLIEAVLVSSRALDDALETANRDESLARLEARDRGFARLIAATVLRRLGSLDHVLGHFLERPLSIATPRPRSILLSAAAQILVIGTPAHAAINLAVEQCRRDPKAQRFDKLANAVLRKVANLGPAIMAKLDTPRIDIPEWLWNRWVAAYGEAAAIQIATASLAEAPLDITAKENPAVWAGKLGGEVLSTGSIRLAEAGRIEELPGYQDGAWWVQDAAAALPARILGKVSGLEVADLCAAPGGKSAALAVAGAHVTAVDISADRLERLDQNMARLGLSEAVSVVAANLSNWEPGRVFDGVLLDAPCLSTGTIRRHPDLLHLKRPSDLERIVALQQTLIERASKLVAPGGRFVYCVCSLEPEEGVDIVAAFLSGNAHFERLPVTADDIAGSTEWITSDGDLRTLPYHSPSPDRSGMDGFYAARLVRKAN